MGAAASQCAILLGQLIAASRAHDEAEDEKVAAATVEVETLSKHLADINEKMVVLEPSETQRFTELQAQLHELAGKRAAAATALEAARGGWRAGVAYARARAARGRQS